MLKTGANLHKPCAGGINKSIENSPIDYWLVAVVKRHSELRCHDFLSRLTGIDYPLESYVAAQQELKFYANRTRRISHHVVIPGKIFIRVDEKNRQDVLKQCLLLSRYLKDPSTITPNGFTDFMKVSDAEICQLRSFLEKVDAPVEYIEHTPHKNDKIQVLTGRFAGLKGRVYEENNNRFVVITLDQLGDFRCKLPISEIGLLQ